MLGCYRLVLHAKVSDCTERKRGDRGFRTKKSLIVAVVGYAVCAVGVVVDEAEIVGCFRENLGKSAEMVKALRYGTRGRGRELLIWMFGSQRGRHLM